jgi:hypothetical protein
MGIHRQKEDAKSTRYDNTKNETTKGNGMIEKKSGAAINIDFVRLSHSQDDSHHRNCLETIDHN